MKLFIKNFIDNYYSDHVHFENALAITVFHLGLAFVSLIFIFLGALDLSLSLTIYYLLISVSALKYFNNLCERRKLNKKIINAYDIIIILSFAPLTIVIKTVVLIVIKIDKLLSFDVSNLKNK